MSNTNYELRRIERYYGGIDFEMYYGTHFDYVSLLLYCLMYYSNKENEDGVFRLFIESRNELFKELYDRHRYTDYYYECQCLDEELIQRAHNILIWEDADRKFSRERDYRDNRNNGIYNSGDSWIKKDEKRCYIRTKCKKEFKYEQGLILDLSLNFGDTKTPQVMACKAFVDDCLDFNNGRYSDITNALRKHPHYISSKFMKLDDPMRFDHECYKHWLEPLYVIHKDFIPRLDKEEDNPYRYPCDFITGKRLEGYRNQMLAPDYYIDRDTLRDFGVEIQKKFADTYQYLDVDTSDGHNAQIKVYGCFKCQLDYPATGYRIAEFIQEKLAYIDKISQGAIMTNYEEKRTDPKLREIIQEMKKNPLIYNNELLRYKEYTAEFCKKLNKSMFNRKSNTHKICNRKGEKIW